MSLDSFLALAAFFGLCFVTASSGAIFKPGQWYEDLAKPWWRPPNWLFPPAWTVLFATIAVSGWLVWRKAGLAGAAIPLAVYVVQLGFNFAWSGLFFGMRRPDLAFIEVMFLWGSILATIVNFDTVDPFAAWLLVPYLLWVTFAAGLNCAIWRMNRVAHVAAGMGA
jgi:tryptophan-rich sensory protein